MKKRHSCAALSSQNLGCGDASLGGELNVERGVRWYPPALPIGQHLWRALERPGGLGLGALEVLDESFERCRGHGASLHRSFKPRQHLVDDTVNVFTYPVGMAKLDSETTVSAGLLLRWLDDTDTKPAEFGRKIGVSDQVINNWKRRGIPRGRLTEVVAAMGISHEDYLVDPHGERKWLPWRSVRGNAVPLRDLTFTKVPLVSWVQAGHKNLVTDPFPPGAPEEWENATTPVSKEAFALRVRGDSMVAPDGSGFPEGSIIFVDPTVEARSGDYVVVRFQNSDEATFKRLVVDGPLKFLKPLNPTYPTIPITDDARLAGVVVEHQLTRRFR